MSEPGGPPELTGEDRRQLLAIARQAVAAHLSRARFAPPEGLTGAAASKRAAFVTLRRRADGELRGCIGTLEPRDESLADVVARIAVAAATQDARFAPVSAEELPSLAIEISVLTAPTPIDPARVEPGRHGLIVRHAGCGGLLLPQVATEHDWDRETFLGYTCRKAGLPPDAWKDPAALVLAFTAIVFGDE